MRSASMWLLCKTCIIGHCVLLHPVRGITLVDLVFEEARRRWRRHELAVHLGGDPAVLDQLAVAEFDLQQLRLGVVSGGADLARIDALAFHALVSLLSCHPEILWFASNRGPRALRQFPDRAGCG